MNSGKKTVIPIAAQEEHQLRFGSVLKEYRKKANISQKDCAEMMHVTRNTIVNWENDKSKPDYGMIPELCSLLGIRLHELFYMQAENDLSPLEDRVVRNLRFLTPGSQRVVDKMVSAMVDEELMQHDAVMKESFGMFVYRPGTLAAGVGDVVPDTPPAYMFLRKNSMNSKADGIARVHGDSMEPVYHDGDFVYYRETDAADPGEDVVADTNDGAVIKRVAQDGKLCSVNPDYPYPEKGEQDYVKIRGIVLGTVQPSDMPSGEEGSLLEEIFADEIRVFREENCIPDGWQ